MVKLYLCGVHPFVYIQSNKGKSPRKTATHFPADPRCFKEFIYIKKEENFLSTSSFRFNFIYYYYFFCIYYYFILFIFWIIILFYYFIYFYFIFLYFYYHFFCIIIFYL